MARHSLLTLGSRALLAIAVLCAAHAGAEPAPTPPPVAATFHVRWSEAIDVAQLPASAAGALRDALGVPYTVTGVTRDGAMEVTLGRAVALEELRAALNRLRLHPDVLYADVHRTPPAVVGKATPKAGQQQATVDRMIVKYRAVAGASAAHDMQSPDPTALDRLAVLAGQPLVHHRVMGDGAHVLALFQALAPDDARAAARRIESDPNVEYAEPDLRKFPLMVPNDPFYASQWNYKSPPAEPGGANLPPAWDITTGSTGIVVAVIDTGSMPGHPDLAGRYIGGYDFIGDVLVANDGDGRDPNAADPGDWITSAENSSGYFQGCGASSSSFHGTHVAGTIGAASNNGVGVSGINWVSRILPIRVLGKCGGYTSDIADGMRWAVGLPVPGVPTNPNPARVLNLSLGGYACDASGQNCACDTTSQSAIDAALGAGAVVVVAAGNSNTSAIEESPANCSGVVTVAATGRAGQRASYSNYGPVVEIAAPGGADGQGILSTLNNGTTTPNLSGYTYVYYQGTSMATPHVTGIASLMLSINPALTPAQVLALLQTTARAFPTGTGRDCTTSLCGAGLVDAGAAVAAAQAGIARTSSATVLAGAPNPVNAGAVVTFTATVNGTAPTGSVAFTDNGAAIAGCGALALAGSGNARTAGCSTTALTVGTHNIVASYAGDSANTPSTSATLVETVNAVTIAPGTTVWVEDAVPPGAQTFGDAEGWTWVAANPPPFSGSLAHQSANGAGEHQHYFWNASGTLPVNAGDTLYAYVYLDPANPPAEVMLQWNDGTWEHRAYWGQNQIAWGADGTVSRRFMGALPAAGQWVRLAVAASAVGLEGRVLNGMAFTLYNGRATWDQAGKVASTGGIATATATSLVSSSNPATVGANVAFTATVTGTAPTGSVGFTDNGTTIAGCSAVALSGSGSARTAACSTTALSAGTHAIVASYGGDTANLASTSATLTETVNAVAPPSGTTVWVEDGTPAGAVLASGGENWAWISANPTPFSGALAHQSAIVAGAHQHYFYNATATLAVGTGDTLYAYVYLDPANPPSEVMLQWNDGTWEHRAYWGANQIPWGADGTVGRRYMGPLPVAGQWVQLAVPASLVGLEGRTLNGMAFSLYNGRATWDQAGKTAATGTPPPPTPVTWFDDATPAGAQLAGMSESWAWVSANPTPFSGSSAHRSAIVAGAHQHYFVNASATLTVNTGDTLYAYVYLDPANAPTEVMLQWNDGTWEHRAYWGQNQIAWGTDGTVSRRYMGPLPTAGQWVQLAVSASLVGLEGRVLNGMAFSLFNGRATWDQAGKY